MNAMDSFSTISVPHPVLKLILTPPRESDGDPAMKAHADPKVYLNLSGPPFPYTQKDWENWYAITAKAAEQSLAELRDVHIWEQHAGASAPGDRVTATKRPWLGKGLWNSTIRDVVESEQGAEEEQFVGAITVDLSGFSYIRDETKRKQLQEENESLEPGDPRIVREVGFFLTPEYHGRGIMPAVLRTLMAEILVPYMNVHTLIGTYFEHNIASRRVFEKCGFVFQELIPTHVTINPRKIGGEEGRKVGLGVLEWRRELST